MKYPPQIIDQLKARLNILDEVRKVVPAMKKKGRYWWGNCPFHSEKSPSFHVRDEQGSYYCFGCGASGDVLKFVQETQGGTFGDVVERLAKQVGLKLPEKTPENPAARAAHTDGLKALERAAIFFQRCLHSPEGASGLRYLENRQLSPETMSEFGLGFAPESFSATKDALLSEGFRPETLRAAGLTVESTKGRGDYDRFRGRVMFPIHNGRGEAVGFGGRVMDKSEPKYLNTADTAWFNKSYLLYNLHRARPHVKTSGAPVLVEGYMDVIALWQAGLKTAVAPLGTAVTSEQLRMLWQQHPCPLVCLDGDAAGRTAATRAALRACETLEPGHSLGFVFLPHGEDPDSLVRKDGLGALRTLMANPVPLEQVLWQHISAGLDLATADGKAAAEAALAELLRTITNATVRRAYAQSLKDKLWQGTRTGKTFTKKPTDFGAAPAQAPLDYGKTLQGDSALRFLLALVCRWPNIVGHVDELIGELPLPPGPLTDLARHLMRVHARATPDHVTALADLLDGPHAAIVDDILASSGVRSLPDDTDALALFQNQFGIWQDRKHHQKRRTETLRTMKWFDPLAWNDFKALNDNSPPDPTSPLTGGGRRPI